MRRKIKDELGNLWIIPSSEYEGFSKQDLLDRIGALNKEFDDNTIRQEQIRAEIERIIKLLKEK